MINRRMGHPSTHLQKGAHVETKGDLSRRMVGRSREARDERTVEAADARLGFVGVNRGLPQFNRYRRGERGNNVTNVQQYVIRDMLR